jgi:hypothetical protein
MGVELVTKMPPAVAKEVGSLLWERFAPDYAKSRIAALQGFLGKLFVEGVSTREKLGWGVRVVAGLGSAALDGLNTHTLAEISRPAPDAAETTAPMPVVADLPERLVA